MVRSYFSKGIRQCRARIEKNKSEKLELQRLRQAEQQRMVFQEEQTVRALLDNNNPSLPPLVESPNAYGDPVMSPLTTAYERRLQRKRKLLSEVKTDHSFHSRNSQDFETGQEQSAVKKKAKSSKNVASMDLQDETIEETTRVRFRML